MVSLLIPVEAWLHVQLCAYPFFVLYHDAATRPPCQQYHRSRKGVTSFPTLQASANLLSLASSHLCPTKSTQAKIQASPSLNHSLWTVFFLKSDLLPRHRCPPQYLIFFVLFQLADPKSSHWWTFCSCHCMFWSPGSLH